MILNYPWCCFCNLYSVGAASVTLFLDYGAALAALMILNYGAASVTLFLDYGDALAALMILNYGAAFVTFLRGFGISFYVKCFSE
jgi:hypothetical protein